MPVALRAIGRTSAAPCPAGYHVALTPEDRVYDAAEHPRIFEVGREGAVDLSVVDVEGVRTIHPLRADLEHSDNQGQLKQGISPSSATVTALVGIGLFVGTVLAWTNQRLWLWVSRSWRLFAVVGLIILVGTAVFCGHGWRTALMANHDEGEPFSWTAGVSIWPGEWLRLLVVMLVPRLPGQRIARSDKNSDQLTEEFLVPHRSRPSLPIHPEDILDQCATGLSSGRHQSCHSPSIKPGSWYLDAAGPLQRIGARADPVPAVWRDHDFPGSLGRLTKR